MKEYPVLFSPPMVRQIRADRKFVTRRLDPRWRKVKAGDRLWVREGWRPTQENSDQIIVRYYADGDVRRFGIADVPDGWRMPKAAAKGQVTCLFMPRWASRILLECEEDAREERLQDITEGEAIAEGVSLASENGPWIHGGKFSTYRAAFFDLWGTLHPKPGERFADNPTVIRVGRFRRIAEAL